MDKQEQHRTGFFNGLLLGMVFGVVLTLLLVTKKGRKMLRAMTEEGKEGYGQLRSRFFEMEKMVDDELLYDDVKEEMSMPTNEISTKEETSLPVHHVHSSNGVKKHPRRLFKGIPKK